jgi:hypothetical protein
VLLLVLEHLEVLLVQDYLFLQGILWVQKVLLRLELLGLPQVLTGQRLLAALLLLGVLEHLLRP